jgi:hypothetical protein
VSLKPNRPGGLPPRHMQFLMILAATVVGWVAIVSLSLMDQPEGAVVIGAVWTATCGLLAF